MGIIPNTGKTILASIGLVFCLLWAAPGTARKNPDSMTLVIATDDRTFSTHLDCFKAGMAEFGYIENRNIRYILYDPIEKDSGTNTAATARILSEKPDLIFTLGNRSASWALGAIQETRIPALFSMISTNPVEEGIVESLSIPKGNITGIRVPDILPKALEWLKLTVPGIQNVYLPYNPADRISVLALDRLVDAAPKLGIVLTLHEIHSVEEAIEAIETLPEEIDALFRVPSHTLDMKNKELDQATIRKKLPTGTAHRPGESVLVSFQPDVKLGGRQAARLANQILRGANPADLPVETLEVTLTINLGVAEKIGVQVPNSVLVNADTIIR